MTTFEMFLFWPLAVVLLGLVIIGIVKLFDGSLVKDTGFADDYRKFMDDTRARGLSYHDACLEWATRTAFARLRRESTEAVLADLANWKTALDRCVQEAFDRLARENPDILPLFGQMVGGLCYGDILYPIAAKAVDRRIAGYPAMAPSGDQRAALRIVKG